MHDKFLSAYRRLAGRIQWLADHDHINEGQALFYSQILEDLAAAYNDMEAYISTLENRNHYAARAALLRQEHTAEHIERLEAIILIHGITDINSQLFKPRGLLVEQAVKNMKERAFNLPYEFLNSPKIKICQ